MYVCKATLKCIINRVVRIRGSHTSLFPLLASTIVRINVLQKESPSDKLLKTLEPKTNYKQIFSCLKSEKQNKI